MMIRGERFKQISRDEKIIEQTLLKQKRMTKQIKVNESKKNKDDQRTVLKIFYVVISYQYNIYAVL